MKPWIYQGKEIKSTDDFPNKEAIGFIYLVKNIYGYWYIGKKNIYSNITKPPLKGYKRRRKMTKESNWLTYKSSNKSVKDWEDFEFESRIIIDFAYTKKHLTYLECHALFSLNVLRNDMCLNDNILGKFFSGDLINLPNEETN
jgi:hypothetical protein